jgi:TolA-binding protein
MKISGRSATLLILLYLTLIAAWGWRLSPSYPENVPVEDPEDLQTKVASYLALAPKDTTLPALIRLVHLPKDHLHYLADWVDQDPLKQLKQLTVQKSSISELGPEWEQALFQTWLNHKTPLNLTEAHQLIAAAAERLSAPVCQDGLERLAQRALAQGDPAEAVTIFGRATELPGATWETLLQLISACRSARNTTPALRALSMWIKRHQHSDLIATLEQARDLQLSMMLESHQTSEALSLQLSHLTGAPPYSERALDRAYLAARHAHQGTRLLQVLERHVQTFPEHKLSLVQLSKKADVHPDYIRWITSQAAIADEELPRSIAFDYLERLAATRNAHALPRLCALATSVPMKTKLGHILKRSLDQPETQTAVLELAQSDSVARRVVSEKLHLSPQNRELHFSNALAAASKQKHGSASMIWQDFLRRFPKDVAAQKRLIQAYLHEQQPQQALRIYKEISSDALSPEDHEQWKLLLQL